MREILEEYAKRIINEKSIDKSNEVAETLIKISKALIDLGYQEENKEETKLKFVQIEDMNNGTTYIDLNKISSVEDLKEEDQTLTQIYMSNNNRVYYINMKPNEFVKKYNLLEEKDENDR